MTMHECSVEISPSDNIIYNKCNNGRLNTYGSKFDRQSSPLIGQAHESTTVICLPFEPTAVIDPAFKPPAVIGPTGEPPAVIGPTGELPAVIDPFNKPQDMIGPAGEPTVVIGPIGEPLSVIGLVGEPQALIGPTGEPYAVIGQYRTPNCESMEYPSRPASEGGTDSGRGEDLGYEEGMFQDGYLVVDGPRPHPAVRRPEVEGASEEAVYAVALPHSGVVRAVPVLALLENIPQVHKGEYENLVPDNQYYEHVEFSVQGPCYPPPAGWDEENLYSIPQVLRTPSPSPRSQAQKTSLTAQALRVDMFGLTRQFPSIRNTDKKNKKKLEVKKNSEKKLRENSIDKTSPFYSLPRKCDERKKCTKTTDAKNMEDDNKLCPIDHSYMSIQDRKKSSTTFSILEAVPPKQLRLVLLVLAVLLAAALGIYFITANVVTVAPESRRQNMLSHQYQFPTQYSPSVDGDPAGTLDVLLEPLSAALEEWGAWSQWSKCSSNPCVRGQTMARSRKCLKSKETEGNMKVCLEQGGINVEIEPCFCF